MRILRVLLLLLCIPIVSDAAMYTFDEVWAYVYRNEEAGLRSGLPVTDVAYFSVPVNDIGRLTASLDPSVIRNRVPKGTRVHCVVSAPYNLSLLHWCINKDRDTREALLDDIVRVSEGFDGVQIDFESIRAADGEAYYMFLRDLKVKLPKERMISAALPARVREMQDGYPYEKIGKVVDRVLIMAYDEHYRTGQAGPIASSAWCKRVATFAQQKIAKEKLIMALPLYGRVWQTQHVAKALKYPQTLALWNKHRSLLQRDADGTPYFSFQETIDAVEYFEDVISLSSKLAVYESMNVQAVGFWRLTQEPAALWEHVFLRSP